MITVDLTKFKDLTITVCGQGDTIDYAAAETKRLLKLAGINTKKKAGCKCHYAISIGAVAEPDISEVKYDGFVKSCYDGGITIAATCAKGVLNGIYTLAEELGFAFVMPGKDGERVPAKLKPVAKGDFTINPRFPHRGIFASSHPEKYDAIEFATFLAKLRFNALCSHADTTRADGEDWLKVLGFRVEAGGHGMSACLPRDMYETEPELFRMFQPEDFGGKRMKDSNFCITNPKTRAIVKENFKKKIADAGKAGIYAVHAWADDLPGGGWCMCSRCRGLTGSDQSALTMNVEAQAIREEGYNMRVPVIAYHDTMFPSDQIAPDPLCYFLFAPRERCYGHALNDPNCALNKVYLQALKAYAKRFKGIDDAHTFEYYNDKLLFRGHTPYLPNVIIGDADAYEENDITCWMSLQVGGELVGVDWNMLAHAEVAWKKGLTEAELNGILARKVADSDYDAWYTYLGHRAEVYETAWQVCDYPYDLYFDYRFLPEHNGAVGAKLISNLTDASAMFERASADFDKAIKKFKGFESVIAKKESARNAFETKDLKAMVPYARAMYLIADSWNTNDKATIACAIDSLKASIAGVTEARKAFAKIVAVPGDKDASHGHYYMGYAKNVINKEMENKIRVYEQALKD